MKKCIHVFIASLVFLTAMAPALAQQVLVGYWNFNQGANGQPWNAPIVANQSEGNATITAGNWIWGNIDYTEGFAGSTVNALGGDPAGASLSLRSQEMNGNYIQFEFSMEGMSNLEISYWSRRTATGFNANQWSWSTDGVNFTNFGPVVNPAEASAGALVSLPELSALDNAPTAYLRYTLNGATSATGNNRIDNLQLNATEVGDPNTVATPQITPGSGTYYEPQMVQITTGTPDATIYYTLNGQDPTQADTPVSGPVEITQDAILKARAFKSGLNPSSVATAEYTIRSLLLFKDFEDESITSGGWMVYDVFSGANTWVVDNFAGIYYAMITEYQSSPPNPHSWLISPEIDLGSLEEVSLQFMNQAAHRTGDALRTLISSNYSGSGNPANATWVELPVTYDPHSGPGFGTWTSSGAIDLMPWSGENVHIAFEYQADANNVGRWHVTDVMISGIDPGISGNANLSVFTIGGMNALQLSGVEVTDPVNDPGAILYVEDFLDFGGIVANPAHEAATRTVKINGILIDEASLPTQPVAFEDVILVSVTAENQTTVKHYKVTALGENRILAFVTPEGGETYQTGDDVLISWNSENINLLNLYVFMQGIPDPVDTYTNIPAISGSVSEPLRNGAHGNFFFRLRDSSDPNYFVDSELVSFEDTQAPLIESFSPAAGAVNVALNTQLVMVFDERVWKNQGEISLYKTAGNELLESIAVGSSQVTVNAETFTVSVMLSTPLDYETSYYVLLDQGTFEDIAENPFAGINDPAAWSFTTEAEEEFQLICNGDFELWTGGKPDCWFGSKTNMPAASVSQYADAPQSGQYAVRLMNSSATHQRFTSQATTVESGMAYEISFWVKGQGEIRTGLFDDRSTGFGYAPYNPYIMVNTDSWQQQTQVVIAETNSNQAEFIFSLRSTAEASGHLQLDNVIVQALGDETEELPNIAALRQATIGGVYKLANEVILTFQQSHRNQKYIQDATAAMLIDDPDGVITQAYQIGDGITGIEGTLIVNNQMLQFSPRGNPGPPSSGGNEIIPEVRTLASLTSDDQAKLIRIENVSFANPGGTFATGTNYNLNSASGTGVFRTSFFDANYIGTTIPAQPQILTVLVNQFMATIQVTARSLADFEVYTSVSDPDQVAWQVFPNPFNAVLNLSGFEAGSRIQLMNQLGQVIIDVQPEGESHKIDTSHLQSGIYFVRITDVNQQMHTVKLIRP